MNELTNSLESGFNYAEEKLIAMGEWEADTILPSLYYFFYQFAFAEFVAA